MLCKVCVSCSFSVRALVMDKSPERTNHLGPFVIVTVMEKDDVVALFFTGMMIQTSKQIEVGNVYDFVFHAVVVRAPYDTKVGSRENFYGQSLLVKGLTLRMLDEKRGIGVEVKL